MASGKPQNTSDGGDPKASNKRDAAHDIVPLSPQIPPTPVSGNKSEREKKWWPNTLKQWVEVLGVGILLVYTIYTIKLYNAAKDANKQAKMQWNAEHRPWIGNGEIEVRQPVFVFYPGNPPQMKTQFSFTVEVPIKNVGISPAFHVETNVMGTLTEQIAAPPTLGDMMVTACKGADSNAKNIGGVLFPNNAENRFEESMALGSSIPEVSKIHRVWLTICTAYSDNGASVHHTKIWFASWPINGELPEMRDPAHPGIVYYAFPSTRWSVIKMEAD